jgi:signal transduction histidine kinase
MKSWFRGKRGGAVAFLLIAGLVAGGLGWVTAAALRLEREQLEARAQADLQGRVQFALSLLDSRVRSLLAREDGRPYNHYSAVYASSQALGTGGQPLGPGAVREPSPLLSADLPDWMLLHFQVDEENGWDSPQVLAPALRKQLEDAGLAGALADVTPERARLLADLRCRLPARALLAAARQQSAEPSLHDVALVPAPGPNNDLSQANSMPQGQQIGDQLARLRQGQQVRLNQEAQARSQKDDAGVARENFAGNNSDVRGKDLKKDAHGRVVEIVLSPMVPVWLAAEGGEPLLVFARVVRVEDHEVCQGVVLDWRRLQAVLAAEVSDLFPEARVLPVHDGSGDDPERAARTMAALPFQLDPGPEAAAIPAVTWTPLRVGLCLAWAAALVALVAVGLGGWSLLDLSERRIRFVSAVTHELRTPLTTLRLYLDMLTGGMVRDARQQHEYLHTLHAEADRLNRLIANVLDYSRLENQRPRLAKAPVRTADLLGQVCSAWGVRCRDAGKVLVVDHALPAETEVHTDAELVQQVLGNLLDNACKYSRGAADERIWLRARQAWAGRIVLEVEDRGPGVAPRERRAIFRTFRRGRHADVSTGGVGLGLALARRWARLLGGRLSLHGGADGIGACFRLEVPGATGKPAEETTSFFARDRKDSPPPSE